MSHESSLWEGSETVYDEKRWMAEADVYLG